MSDTPRLELQKVHKRFGSNQVLRGVSFKVQPGTSYVIIGGSGSGKSVSLRCALGLTEADSGTVRVDGRDVTHLPFSERQTVNKRFGMLFQNSALFDSLSVLDNVAFPLIHAHGRKKAEARSAARDTLPRLGLDEAVADLKPAELSGGMRKRVALARAIVAEPEIIFFDEPTTGLDPIMSAVINDLVNNQVRRLGAAAVTITHDLSSASAIGDRVGFLYQGEIVWEGPLDQLYDSGDERVDQFVNGRAEGPIPVLKS